jgi:hypothetical protein
MEFQVWGWLSSTREDKAGVKKTLLLPTSCHPRTLVSIERHHATAVP